MKHSAIIIGSIVVGVVVLILVLSGVLFTPAQVLDEAVERGVTPVTFVERAPVTGSRPAKALLVFHGEGGNAERVETQANFSQLGRTNGFLVVYPEANESHWNDHRSETDAFGDDVAEVRTYIESLRADGVREVYVTGISNGGMFAFRLACELSDIIDGAAPVAANLPAEGINCNPEFALPLLIQQGTADPISRYEGGDIESLNQSHSEVGGEILSAADTLDFWTSVYGCNQSPTESALDLKDADRVTVTQFDWAGCRDDVRFTQLRYEGGGHTWYGSGGRLFDARLVGPAGTDVSATEQIVVFFGLGVANQ